MSYICDLILNEMKKLLLLGFSILSLMSCHNEVEFNNPGFQAQIDNTLWKANTKNVVRATNGSITITGYSQTHELKLTTSSANVGIYSLGTSNSNNFALYTQLSDTSIKHTTIPTTAGVYEVDLLSGGTGYSTSNIVPVTGGSGTGLRVNIEANTNSTITKVVVNVPGSNYHVGDVITVSGGDTNAQIRIKSLLNANGEIRITENTGATISGSFKFTAFDANTNTVVSCKDGIFYKLPIQ